jgi:stage II sporulation protein M
VRQAWIVVKENLVYLLVVAGMFGVGWSVAALMPERMEPWVLPGIEHIRGLADQVDGRRDGLELSWLIFRNNLQAAAVLLLMGIPFGVGPILGMFFNGMVAGFVFAMLGPKAGGTLEAVVFGLLPHGVFELAAIFLAAALGLKAGRVLVWPLKGMGRRQSLRSVSREVGRVSWVVVLLLFLAALIEGLVTPVLMETFLLTNGN